MTTHVEHCFVDTNVLIYSTVTDNPWYNAARCWLTTLYDQETHLYISPQILREYLVVLTRGQVFTVQFSVEQAITTLEELLLTLNVLEETQRTAVMLRKLVSHYQVKGKRIHDANVVATMVTHNVTHLIAYNQADFATFQEIELLPIPSPSS
jgi:predicted nucleic acid-binding protein